MTNHFRAFIASFAAATLVAASCLFATPASAGMVPTPASVGVFVGAATCIVTGSKEGCALPAITPPVCTQKVSAKRRAGRAVRTTCQSTSGTNQHSSLILRLMDIDLPALEPRQP